MNKERHEIDLEQLQLYVDGQLDPKDRAAVNAHLGHCPECRGLVSQLNELERAISDAECPSVPQGYFETLASRVAGGIAQRKMARKKKSLRGIFNWGGMPIAAAASLVILLVISVNLFYSGEFSSPREAELDKAVSLAKDEEPTLAKSPEKKSLTMAAAVKEEEITIGLVAGRKQGDNDGSRTPEKKSRLEETAFMEVRAPVAMIPPRAKKTNTAAGAPGKETSQAADAAGEKLPSASSMPHMVYEVKTIVICLPGGDSPCQPPEISTAIEIDIPNGG
ncbi:MAG: zf-HC2 domain-containing protein [Candidatus Edwardsbacteria bacterium]|nr:zf-HC2 domain-containing protein [Candidatus Edwardsbacteria bacterium]